MTTAQLRKKYLDFFQAKTHRLFASDSLVPKNDPTLLFTSAGMNQFKDYFLGKRLDVTRAVSCQKCLRTGDLERVGQTAYHHTFFEMLGNFSFGDYFKQEAIVWAWEFVTKELNLKEQDLAVSVYQDDREAFDFWKNTIGLPETKVYCLGAQDNFWPQNALLDGPDGPCGPCSEIFFDFGKDTGCLRQQCNPSCSCGRFVEVWNLVFTQFNRIGLNQTQALPAKNIDTGMGLERMASVLQGKRTNFDIDILQPLGDEVRRITGSQKKEIVNAISDHVRAMTFSIADGIYPSNEDRGYVVRKILRRALWFGFSSGRKEAFLHKLVGLVVLALGDVYPEIVEKQDTVKKVILAEEERFLATLDKGKEVIFDFINLAKRENRNMLKGEECFKLYDTYGFPSDLTSNIAAQQGITIDRIRFDQLLENQKQVSRQCSKFEASVFVKDNLCFKHNSEFIGYEHNQIQTRIIAVIFNNQLIDQYCQTQEIAVVLERTPFYPVQGGQIFDTGIIRGDNFELEVISVEKLEGTIFHRVRLKHGTVRKSDKVTAMIDLTRRRAVARAHTATHLLQAALRKILGGHIQQQGSFVEEDYLRFDFNHFKGLSAQELSAIACTVNEYIQADIKVEKQISSFSQAKEKGALAFFEEKYEDEVRVISIGDISKELCGGTHLDSTAQVLMLVILNEGSVSSGIRRVEAITGKKAFNYINAANEQISGLSRLFKVEHANVEKTVVTIWEKNKAYEKSLTNIKKIMFEKITAGQIIEKKSLAGKVNLIVFNLNEDAAFLRTAIDILRKKLPLNTVFAGYSKDQDKVTLNISRTDDLTVVNCNQLAGQIAAQFGGSGGGKNNFAFCGFKIDAGWDEAKMKQVIEDAVISCQ